MISESFRTDRLRNRIRLSTEEDMERRGSVADCKSKKELNEQAGGAMDVNEKDWKLFRAKLPEWQENYMEKLNCEYVALLTGSGKASAKFWGLEKRILQDKDSVGVVARMSRSSMYHNILSLLNDGVITMKELDGFSKDLREKVEFVQEMENSARKDGKCHRSRKNRSLPNTDVIEQDENYAFIAGRTSGGFPYGTTWEEQEMIDRENAQGNGSDEPEGQYDIDGSELPF